MISKSSCLLDETRLSRAESKNWLLSMNRSLPREKDMYFSLLFGMHLKSEVPCGYVSTSAMRNIKWWAS